MNEILSNTIFVTAFMSEVNKINYRSIHNYIEYGKKMLRLNITQITFIEKHIFHSFFKEYDNEVKYYFEYNINNKLHVFEYIIFKNKVFVFFEKKDNYLYAYNDVIKDFHIDTVNPLKDTLEYMFTQCHKTEWVKMAIFLMNQTKKYIPNSGEFIWIDYGIYHMIKNEREFNTKIENIGAREISKLHKNIRIASCWDINYKHNQNIYKTICWYFAGSVFGGPEQKMIEFADKNLKKCIEIILNNKLLMWEINVWYLVCIESSTIFDFYKCGHDDSIIMNY